MPEQKRGPGRPTKDHSAPDLKVAGVTPKLLLYLDAVRAEEGYGSSRSEVARTLIWRGIEELVT